jgi:hypothetical protein
MRDIIVSCAWCHDAAFGEGTTEQKLQLARKHVLMCPDHPAKKLEAENAQLRAALVALVAAARPAVRVGNGDSGNVELMAAITKAREVLA